MERSPTSKVRRPGSALVGTVLGLGLLVVAAGRLGVLVDSPVSAEVPDPTPGATSKIREQNLDPDGLIRVHEQGTADVNVTNSSLNVEGSMSVENFPSSFEVSNFPSIQQVEVVSDGLPFVRLDSMLYGYRAHFVLQPDEIGTRDFESLMYATSVISEDFLDEVLVEVKSPVIVQGDDGVLADLADEGGTPYLWVPVHHDQGGGQELRHLTFMNPLRVNGVRARCLNESEVCQVNVVVLGIAIGS